MDDGKSDRPPDGRPEILTEVEQMARKHTKAALETLLHVANKETAPASARVAAANAILGRTPWADALRMELAAAGEDGRMLLARIAEMRKRRRVHSAVTCLKSRQKTLRAHGRPWLRRT
jgi:hypothetical protein